MKNNFVEKYKLRLIYKKLIEQREEKEKILRKEVEESFFESITLAMLSGIIMWTTPIISFAMYSIGVMSGCLFYIGLCRKSELITVKNETLEIKNKLRYISIKTKGAAIELALYRLQKERNQLTNEQIIFIEQELTRIEEIAYDNVIDNPKVREHKRRTR